MNYYFLFLIEKVLVHDVDIAEKIYLCSIYAMCVVRNLICKRLYEFLHVI